jgi:regulator of sigma E protease
VIALAMEFSTLRGMVGVLLGVGALIFIHELGHFLAAKWAGVRVEVFSLGFGHRLFGFRRGDTDYRVSLLPLGGYVRMLGQADEDPFQAPTDRDDDFRNKTAFQRFVILAAGVVMNLVLAAFGFVAAFGLGIDFVAPEIGAIEPGSPASKADLQVGDVVLEIDGSKILGWQDLQTLVAIADGEIELRVLREGQILDVRATPYRGEEDTYARLGVRPALVVAGFAEGSALEAAGAQAATAEQADRLLNISPVTSRAPADQEMTLRELESVMEQVQGQVVIHVERQRFDAEGRPTATETVPLELEIPQKQEYTLGLDVPDQAWVRSVRKDSAAETAGVRVGDRIVALGEIDDVRQSTLREAVLAAGSTHGEAPVRLVIERPGSGGPARQDLQVALELLNGPQLDAALVGVTDAEEQLAIRRRVGRWLLGVEYRADVVASPVELPLADAEAEPVRLEPGDRLLNYYSDGGLWWSGDVPIASGQSLQRFLRSRQDEPFKISWQPAQGDAEQRSAVVKARPDATQTYGDLGFALGSRLVTVQRGPLEAVALGVHQTMIMTKRIFLMLRSFVTGSVSPSELGGPIQIISVVNTVAKQDDLAKLFHLLAILSVNLAVINILPIPVLDGGHIMFLLIEKLKGRPVSNDVLAYAQWVGLFVILGLMALVFFNDIRRMVPN